VPKKHPALANKRIFRFLLIVILLTLAVYVLLIRTNFISLLQPGPSPSEDLAPPTVLNAIPLPAPVKTSKISLEQTLDKRRDRRDYEDRSIDLKILSQLLWSAQGVNTDWGDRTVFSYKSAHPLAVFVIARQINGLDPGVYQYLPGDLRPTHQLLPLTHTINQSDLDTALTLQPVRTAPLLLIIAGSSSRLAGAMPAESISSYLYLEAGQVTQNVSLQIESLSLGTTPVFSFNTPLLSKLANIPAGFTPLVVMPVGFPKP